MSPRCGRTGAGGRAATAGCCPAGSVGGGCSPAPGAGTRPAGAGALMRTSFVWTYPTRRPNSTSSNSTWHQSPLTSSNPSTAPLWATRSGSCVELGVTKIGVAVTTVTVRRTAWAAAGAASASAASTSTPAFRTRIDEILAGRSSRASLRERGWTGRHRLASSGGRQRQRGRGRTVWLCIGTIQRRQTANTEARRSRDQIIRARICGGGTSHAFERPAMRCRMAAMIQ